LAKSRGRLGVFVISGLPNGLQLFHELVCVSLGFAGAIPAKVGLEAFDRIPVALWRRGSARRDRHAERRPLCCAQRS
jgi:hypothetical protein